MQGALEPTLPSEIDAAWPPMRHVRRGWERLPPEGRRLVSERLARTLATFSAPPGDKRALRRFFSFLAQVEVIAIEVPLSALPTAAPHVRALLERQLADEVFHSALFAAVASRLGGLDEPIPEAERLLDRIRAQGDPRTSAVLLNLIAEGWIENLFDEAVTWGVADELFRIVLEDESRHVEEAHAHAEGMDVAKVEEAVRAFEADLFLLAQHPRVLLPMLAVAGEERFATLGASFLRVHRAALAEVGLAPDARVAQMEKLLEDMQGALPQLGLARPHRVEPATQWRRTALELWDTPRHPVMNGWLDVRIDHVPRRLTTAVVVAAIAQVYAEYPRMNRYTVGGAVWQPDGVSVGVRVGVGDKGEALSTLVVTQADKRSVHDIARILQAGVARLNEAGAQVEDLVPDTPPDSVASILRDEELVQLLPPSMVAAPVTVSNVGKAGLHAGFGAMPGALGQSLEIVIGRIEKRPQWRTWRYKPTETVTLGFGCDHRVIDGIHAAQAMRRLEDALSPAGVERLFARPDTLTAPDAVAAAAMPFANARLLMACKGPAWLCWLFKK